jgi:hypothetical protein
MTERTEQLLADLLEVQRRVLANQDEALAMQRHAVDLQVEAVARQRQAMRIIVPIVLVALAAALLPYAYRWVEFLFLR